MSLLDTASLIVTPNGYKEGKLYSVIPSDGSGDMSVVRATTATRVNSAGLVELVPYNLFSYSEQFDNAYWLKTNSTITANASTAPDGTTTADKLVENALLGEHGVARVGVMTAAGVYALSIFVKAAERTRIGIGNSSAGNYAIFDLSLGTVVQASQGTVTNGEISSIDANGYYRVSCTITVGAAASASITLVSTGTTINYTGDGTSGLFLWGAQLVEGSTAKDYQKTETRLNIPRLDYSNGTCPSLLVEPQRTNLLTYSSSFDLWSQGAVSTTVNNTISPSGIQDADLITANGANTQHYIQKGVSQSAKTYSVFAKMGTQRYIQILTSGTAAPVANFDLQDGVANMVGSNSTASIEDFGNGWWRCILQTNDSLAGDFYINYADSLTMGRFGATISSGTLYLWGAQAEVGSYPTSYIPTTTASVTRNADGNGTLINAQTLNDFVLFYDGLFFDDNVIIFGSGANSAWYVSLSPSLNRVVVDLASGRKYESFNGNIVINQRIKIAIKRASGVIDIFLNGVKLTPNIQVTDTTALSLSSVGWSFSSTFFGRGRMNSAAAWQISLSDAQCQILTTL
jgi:hypothetical protein